jgi:hypothetical protein
MPAAKQTEAVATNKSLEMNTERNVHEELKRAGANFRETANRRRAGATQRHKKKCGRLRPPNTERGQSVLPADIKIAREHYSKATQLTAATQVTIGIADMETMDRTVLCLASGLVEFGTLALMAVLVAITIYVGVLF